MHIEAGFKLVIFLFIFVFLNFYMMLARYLKDLNKIKMMRKK